VWWWWWYPVSSPWWIRPISQPSFYLAIPNIKTYQRPPSMLPSAFYFLASDHKEGWCSNLMKRRPWRPPTHPPNETRNFVSFLTRYFLKLVPGHGKSNLTTRVQYISLWQRTHTKLQLHKGHRSIVTRLHLTRAHLKLTVPYTSTASRYLKAFLSKTAFCVGIPYFTAKLIQSLHKVLRHKIKVKIKGSCTNRVLTCHAYTYVAKK
jgi:hypothetical protein